MFNIFKRKLITGAAVKITPESMSNYKDLFDFSPSEAEPYIQNGDYLLVLKRTSTIVPADKFHKTFAFDDDAAVRYAHLSYVTQIKRF